MLGIIIIIFLSIFKRRHFKNIITSCFILGCCYILWFKLSFSPPPRRSPRSINAVPTNMNSLYKVIRNPISNQQLNRIPVSSLGHVHLIWKNDRAFNVRYFIFRDFRHIFCKHWYTVHRELRVLWFYWCLLFIYFFPGNLFSTGRPLHSYTDFVLLIFYRGNFSIYL